MNNEQIVELLEKLQAAIINSTETIKVCIPSDDCYSRNKYWSEEKIKFVDSERLSLELSNLIGYYVL